MSQSYGSDLPTSLTYIRLGPEAVHLGDLMRSSVRSVTGESYATRPGFQGPAAVRETPQNPRGSGVFSTRPCPCLRTERFEGTVGRQPEQITLPFGQRPASPGLVALRRATVETIARHRTVPHPVLLRAGEKRPVNGFPNRYGIPSRLRFARRPRRNEIAVVASLGFLLRLRTDSPMCKGCSHGTLLLVIPPGSRSSTRYYHQDLHRRRLRAGSRPDPSTLDAATFLLSEA